MSPMHRLLISGAAFGMMAGMLGLLAEAAGIADAWTVTAGIVALLAWIGFERFSRR